jgi:hypothetical protein
MTAGGRMMARKGAGRELQELISAAIAGRLTPAQQERLENCILEDGDALDQLLEAAQLEVDLHDQIGRPLSAQTLASIFTWLRSDIEP